MARKLALIVFVAACGGSAPRPAPLVTTPPPPPPAAAVADDGEDFGPLGIGADFASYRKVTPEPYLSRVHGNRWVNVYVTDPGAKAYVDGGAIPVGTVVVKASFVSGPDGQPSSVAGPIFVMQKRAKGYDPDHDDWWYAIHWAAPPPAEAAKLGGPFYWRGRSERVAYCWDCHESYDRGLGGLVPSSLLPR